MSNITAFIGRPARSLNAGSPHAVRGPVTLPAQLLSVEPQRSAAGGDAEKVQAAGRVTGPSASRTSSSVVPLSAYARQRNHGTRVQLEMAVAWFFCPDIEDKGTTELWRWRGGCPSRARRPVPRTDHSARDGHLKARNPGSERDAHPSHHLSSEARARSGRPRPGRRRRGRRRH